MARASSIILTPTQKKEATINAKVEASKAKAALAELNKARKALVDGYNQSVKKHAAEDEAKIKAHVAYFNQQEKQKNAGLKAQKAVLAAQDKLIAAAQKAATLADQKLLALVPPKAVPSPTAAE